MSPKHLSVEEMPETLEWRIFRFGYRGWSVRCAKHNVTLYSWGGWNQTFFCRTCEEKTSPRDAQKINFLLRMDGI